MDISQMVDSEFAEISAQWEAGRIHDTDFFAFRQLNRPLHQILDVGANRGQSIVSIRVLFPDVEIHSFEANKLLLPVLDELTRSLIPPPVIVYPFGLSDAGGVFKLFIPSASGKIFWEEASTSLQYYEKPWVAEKFRQRGGLQLEEVSCELRIGDDLSLNPDLIKVDVEGAESCVLRGLIQTIKRRRPVIMVENSDWYGVNEVLEPLGYSPFLYIHEQNRFVPQIGTSTNTFYIPVEDAPV